MSKPKKVPLTKEECDMIWFALDIVTDKIQKDIRLVEGAFYEAQVDPPRKKTALHEKLIQFATLKWKMDNYRE